MDLRRLRSFLTVTEQGSVSKAALHLHISQPALSRQIRELQQDLKLRLFDRVGRRLVLTTEGEQLLESCRKVLSHAHALSEHAQQLRHGDTGVLRVVATAPQIETTLSKFLPQFARRYPNVEVKLIESSGVVLALVERGDVHVGLTATDPVAIDGSRIGTYPVIPIDLLAACRPSFPLKARRLADVAEIASHPLLLPDLSWLQRRIFDEVCRVAHLRPNVLLESRAPHTLLAMAEAGLGVAVITTNSRIDRYRVRVVTIAHERRVVQVPQSIVWNKERTLPRYAQDFCESLADFMKRSPGKRVPRQRP
jgi:DNA-binding transcriptional LysR family regulator